MGDSLVMHTQILARTDAPMRTLTRWSQRAGLAEPTMEAIAEYVEEAEKRLFETEGASGGKPWANQAPETEITRAREGTEGRVLDASGDLKRSLTERSDPNAIREIGPGFLRFGSRLSYAEILKRGWNTETQTVPARPPIQLTQRDRYAILKILKGGLSGKINSSIRPSIRSLRGLL
jgi:phage gpG-like protein